MGWGPLPQNGPSTSSGTAKQAKAASAYRRVGGMCWGWTFHFFHWFLCFIQPYYYRIFYCFSVCCSVM